MTERPEWPEKPEKEELRTLLTALAQMQTWQSELLDRATAILGLPTGRSRARGPAATARKKRS